MILDQSLLPPHPKNQREIIEDVNPMGEDVEFGESKNSIKDREGLRLNGKQILNLNSKAFLSINSSRS
jgi:hypothetical protein